MAESERERKKREKREFLEAANKAEQERKRKAQEAAAWGAAIEEEAGKRLDAQWEADAKAWFGDSLDEVEHDIAKYGEVSDEDVRRAMKAIEEGRRAAQGGIFSSGNPQKARKIIKQNRDTIKKAHKKAKSKKGCLAAFAGLAVTASATAYAMYEGAVALAGAIF